jgi:hypothetical protein
MNTFRVRQTGLAKFGSHIVVGNALENTAVEPAVNKLRPVEITEADF